MDVVILTKSFMNGGLCVTGIAKSGEYVRFVRDEGRTPLMAADLQDIDKHENCGPLDCVKVEVVKKVPRKNHTEDVQIKTTSLRKLGTFTLTQLLRTHPAENHDYIFGNASNALTKDEMNSFDFKYSLVFVRVKNFSLRFTRNGEKYKAQCSFDYNGNNYKNIPVTDPEFIPAPGDFAFNQNLGSVYIVVSMPCVPFRNGLYYKFAAKIFLIPLNKGQNIR